MGRKRNRKLLSKIRICLVISVVLFIPFAWVVIQSLQKNSDAKAQKSNLGFGILLQNREMEYIKKSLSRDEIIALSDKRYGDTCSTEASELGFHQNVVSYSFYKSNKGSWIGLNEILQSIETLYPGWFVRIYATAHDIEFLKAKIHDYPFLFYCDIDHLPPPFVSLRHYPASMWRYVAMGDQKIDTVIFRDTDSQIIEREISAVNEWLRNTNKTLHIMRDDRFHIAKIMEGMWGLRITKENRLKLLDIREKIFRVAYGMAKLNIDRPLLKNVVWQTLQDDAISHDSYNCLKHKESLPWPTKRDSDLKFVGSSFYNSNRHSVQVHCPIECRPKDHQDWEFC